MDESDIEAQVELVRSLLRGLRLHQRELAYHRQEVARLREELAQLLPGIGRRSLEGEVPFRVEKGHC